MEGAGVAHGEIHSEYILVRGDEAMVDVRAGRRLSVCPLFKVRGAVGGEEGVNGLEQETVASLRGEGQEEEQYVVSG